MESALGVEVGVGVEDAAKIECFRSSETNKYHTLTPKHLAGVMRPCAAAS